MSAPAMLDELSATLGHAAVLSDPTEWDRYLKPARGAHGRALAVIRPSSTEEVRHVIEWARHHHVRLVPQGANSGLVGASVPSDPRSAVLSLERMAADPVIDQQDRTAVVDAGVPLSQLNEHARRHGLELGIDLASDPSIGGMVATNTGGSRMIANGDMRRHVLGLRTVLADEGCSVVDELTTLRKHNVGASYSQLVIGSAGAFGVVTRVALELTRVPAARACAWLEPADGASTVELLVELERAHGPTLTAFEVVSANALTAATDLVDGTARPFGPQRTPGLSVMVELSSPEDIAADLVASLAELATNPLIRDGRVLPADEAWNVRHSISEGLRRSGTVLGFDVSVARSALPELVDTAERSIRGSFPRAALAHFGHWGDGGVHCNVVFPPDAPPADAERAEVRELIFGLVVDRFGGSFSAEHGLGPVNADWWHRSLGVDTRSTLRAIAAVADPLGILGHEGLPYRTSPDPASLSSSDASSAAQTGGENR